MRSSHKLLITTLGAFLIFSVPFIASAQSEEAVEEPVDTHVFSDVDVGHPEYVALKYLKEKGILEGYNDGSFKPGNLINRIEALKIILEANGTITDDYVEQNRLGGSNYSTNLDLVSFSDIYKSQWYFPYLKKGVEEGVVQGYEDGTFRPIITVNRVESFKMVMEDDDVVLPEVTENPYVDVNMNEWFAPYIQEAKLRQIIYVMMNGTVNPGREMTRSKFAELVYRYMKSKEGAMFGKGSYYHDSLEGNGTSSGEPYRAAELTAAHRTLPFNTVVKVTNLANGAEVTVRINDRGPFITGRVIDLSRSAFETIAHPGTGVIWVEYEIINEV
ncbi:septal ring lytic transglycosylase RlpA family protein [Patescibacteria group bacterium]